MIRATIFGDKAKIRKMRAGKFREAAEAAQAVAIKRAAEQTAMSIREVIREGGDPQRPLSALTYLMRRTFGSESQGALVNTGTYVDAIGARKSRAGNWVISAGPGDSEPASKSPQTIELTQLSNFLENGTVVHVTPRMRKFLAVIGFPLRAETTIMEIPARPHFLPGLERARPKFSKTTRVIITGALKQKGLF